MKEEYLTIKTYRHEAPFRELIQVLEEHRIPYRTEHYRERIEPIGLTTLPPEFIVRVRPGDFPRVNEILHEQAADEVLFADSDHYLFSFADEELFDILASPDEWTPYDYQLARRVLRERGIDVDARLLDSLHEARLNELAQPHEPPMANLGMGYALAVLGGVIGLYIGWNMATAKKTLPDGQQMYVFGERDRLHGRWIAALGTVMTLVWLLLLRGDLVYPF